MFRWEERKVDEKKWKRNGKWEENWNDENKYKFPLFGWEEKWEDEKYILY